jgi:shikimate dehydrogenase
VTPPELYAVFGHPIAHSLSPVMHEAAFRARGWPHRRYIAVDVDTDDLDEAVAAFRRLGGRGLNLTRPLKEAAAHAGWLTARDAWAEAAGAVNTLTLAADGWRGANTDAPALREALRNGRPAPRRAMILGSGGAARATWRALAGVCAVVVASRRLPDFIDAASWVSWDAWLEASASCDLVINATPLGQRAEPGFTGLPRFRPDQTVVDWVYVPRLTPLLAAAQAGGAAVVDGLELLARQAALSWRPWFGEDGPWDVMLNAAAAAC